MGKDKGKVFILDDSSLNPYSAKEDKKGVQKKNKGNKEREKK